MFAKRLSSTINFKSDKVTKPCLSMLQAMAQTIDSRHLADNLYNDCDITNKL